MSPLHHAAYHGLSNIVTHLLSLEEPAPASPLIHDITGRPPYFLAALGGNLECLKLLFPESAAEDRIVLDNFNRNALHYAASNTSRDSECLEYLLNLESSDDESPVFDVNQQDIFGRTPLHYASEFDSEGTTVELLVKHGAKVDSLDKNGLYTVNYASAAGNSSALKTLLDTFYWAEIQEFTVCPTQCAVLVSILVEWCTITDLCLCSTEGAIVWKCCWVKVSSPTCFSPWNTLN